MPAKLRAKRLNLCYFGLWTPKWRKILPCESAGLARAAAPAGSCSGRRSASRPRTARIFMRACPAFVRFSRAQSQVSCELCSCKLPEHLLLVVIRLNAPTKFVELERVKRHELMAGVTERLALLPDNAHVQGHRGHSAEKKTARTALAQRHIGMDGAVAKDACLHQPVGDKITIHSVRVVLGSKGNLVQLQALAVSRRALRIMLRFG